MKLIYTGGGYGGSWPHIPARDLSDSEIAELAKSLNTSPTTTAQSLAAMLVASGLYVKDEVARKTESKSTEKAAEGA